MPYEDLREYIERLESRGLLKWVDTEVDKDWELSCVARMIFRGLPEEKRIAVGFRNVKGYPRMRVLLGAVGASLQVIATALEVEADRFMVLEKFKVGLEGPMEPLMVESGPCKEVVLMGEEADLTCFPIPTWTPSKDPGPFLTPLWVTKDPETGARNVGMYRSQIKGPRRAGIQFGMPDKHAAIHIAKGDDIGRPTHAAMIFGLDPAIYMAGISRYQYGLDEFAVAGGIRGEPVKLVKCETVDLEVPAGAEMVVEGEFLPGEREEEGPFGEYTGYMAGSPYGMPVFHVKCITHRRGPIIQGIISQMPPSESTMIRGTFNEAGLLKHLQRDLKIQGVLDVHILQSSGSFAMVWVKLRRAYPGQVEQVAGAMLGYFGPSHLKWIVFADEDINIRDSFAREWTLSFRVRPDKDIRVITDTAALTLDPSSGEPDVKKWERRGAKIIIDATKKWEYPRVSLPPKKMLETVIQQWDRYGLPPLETFWLPVDIE